VLSDSSIDSAIEQRYIYYKRLLKLRQLLSDALTEIDKGNYPNNIAKDDSILGMERELQTLKANKEKIDSPVFKTDRTILTTVEGRYEETEKVVDKDIQVSIEYVLCPVCSHLLTRYQKVW